MKRVFLIFLVAVSLIAISLYPTTTAAREPATLIVDQSAICLNVVDREPVETGNTFSTATDKLFCFTKILNARVPVEITHVWYFNDIERAKVILPVKSICWRTYSSKIIQKHETGEWHVDILGADNKLLQTLQFKIVSP